jgi:Prealbumin-like fold domain
MLRGNLALFLMLLFMKGTLSFAQSDAGRGTGIEGIVTVSPIRPGPIRKGAETANEAPLPNAAFSVVNETGVVTSFTTDDEGRFRLSLSPGHYVVSLVENRFPRPCGPFEIDIESGKMTKVEWRCDSGMR